MGFVLPNLNEKFKVYVKRVPVADGSLTELVTILKTSSDR
ncbi:hypothetical protein NR458_01660 [Pediococcus ethanolidurans]|nr:hypothetical protein [Pediococcus ethanolidurans]MCV3323008.1 hypothetical protein [Pediococcus ethanolidurans]MCV3554651.1 hypothetical protein [Pediococcus ethanolidurans]